MLALLGIDDVYVWLAYVLCVASALLCVVYGAINWNKGEEQVEEEDLSWAQHEREVEEDL
ncbi:MAG: symporter small accessory protein [Phycisphaerae bacterium]